MMDEITDPLFIKPKEDNVLIKFKDDHLLDDHVKLLKRYKSVFKLPNSTIFPEEHCEKDTTSNNDEG